MTAWPRARRCAAVLAATAALISAGGAASANPLVVGNARFTVVTPECVRLEYREGAAFVDAPSMFAVGREARAEWVNVQVEGETLLLDTGRMRLRYTPDGRPFSAENLSVVIDAGDREVTWTPESRQAGNLGGTINTLDQVKGPVDLGEGILSRDGWYLIDDSEGFLLVNDWVEPRPGAAGTDWYLFGYDSDYAAAFEAFTTIGGKVPMPRKAVLGSWYSRWWHYTDEDYKGIVREYEQHDFPLDIIVMDMEWHTGDWTGWSWNHELLPDPPALLKWFGDQGLTVTLNVHPHSGIRPGETMYEDFMREMGADPAGGETIEFDAGDKRYMEAYFRHTHHPREEEGVDFWWLDWQQYPEVLSIPGLLNLSWLNHLYFKNSMRTGLRGLQFSRWGAWGDHRHPIHFSGDADTGWTMLGFEVPFTSTAANEGAYFWSHDIGGHFGDRNEETYTRWVQFAATNAAMRLHSGIIEYLDRRPWKWADWATESMRHAFHLRSRLMPYVYSAVHETHATSLPLNRPMYIGWPEEADAYRAPAQYLFGSELLVAPIASPGYGPGRVGSQAVWFPEGEWFNVFTGEAITGPQWRLVSADMNEFPMYVRGGVPVPMQPYSARPTTARLDTLVTHVWPGPDGVERAFTLYEDDGLTRQYEDGAFATTRLASVRNGDVVEVRLSPAEGSFEGMVTERAHEVVLHAVQRPVRVTVNAEAGEADWDEETRTATVRIDPVSVREGVTVRVEAARTSRGVLEGRAEARRLRGLLGEDARGETLASALSKAARDKSDVLPGLVALAGLGVVENETHYPEVGLIRRVVRNEDSLVDGAGVEVAWQRRLVPDGETREMGRSRFERVRGAMELTKPDYSKVVLGFLESAEDERVMTFDLDGEPVRVTKPLGVHFGGLDTWRVSEVFPFERTESIDDQEYAPETMTVAELVAASSQWKAVRANVDGIVDLGGEVGGENVIAYSVATIEREEAERAVLSFRSDDGIEVWLNGEKVHSANVLRGINHPWEEVEVDLRAGSNVLLVKVSQAEFGWGFVVAGRLVRG